jgi:hypothetical protein
MTRDRGERRGSPKSAAKPKSKIKRLRLYDDSRDEDVGYRKPPRAYQFKPGQSGNPKGRRKGRKK